MELQKKPLEISYSNRSLADLVDMVTFIGANSKASAHNMHRRIKDRIALAAEFPGIGKPSQNPAHAKRGVQFTSEGKYHIYYRVQRKQLRVLHIRHSAMRAPSLSDLFDENE